MRHSHKLYPSYKPLWHYLLATVYHVSTSCVASNRPCIQRKRVRGRRYLTLHSGAHTLGLFYSGESKDWMTWNYPCLRNWTSASFALGRLFHVWTRSSFLLLKTRFSVLRRWSSIDATPWFRSSMFVDVKISERTCIEIFLNAFRGAHKGQWVCSSCRYIAYLPFSLSS